MQIVVVTFILFILLVTTSDVVNIILDFTAVDFMSKFNNVDFNLSLQGRYKSNLNVEAERIKELFVSAHITHANQHLACRCLWSCVTMILLACVLSASFVLIIYAQYLSKFWLTPCLRTQITIDNDTQTYSRCYNRAGVYSILIKTGSFSSSVDPWYIYKIMRLL